MVLIFRAPKKLSSPPSEMTEFVKSLIRDDYSQKRNSVGRPARVFEAVAVPLDETLQPIGDPFLALTRSVSLARVSLVHTEPIHASFLRVSLEVVNLGATMVAKVRRHRQLKQYFEVSCEFVAHATPDSELPPAIIPILPFAA
jgi:hypothetical protein